MSRFKVVAMSLALCLGLAACMNGTGGAQPAPSAKRAGSIVEREVEAPDVFSKKDKGLWDGRPSLGGVWVAHPDVTAPERVIIRNTESRKETIGALFRRERMNPGPIFQVSAEAAGAIGMLAGAPTALEVVALRTKEIQTVPPADPAPDAAAPQTGVAQSTEPDAAPAAQDDKATPDATDGTDTLIAVPDTEKPRKRGFFARLFGLGRAQEASQVTPTAQDATATDAPPPKPRAAQPSALDRPFVQIGIFSVESNAAGAAKTMQDAGLSASIKPGKAQGNAFWRVIVGPAGTLADRRQTLAQVKKLGFTDAYAVRR